MYSFINKMNHMYIIEMVGLLNGLINSQVRFRPLNGWGVDGSAFVVFER